MSSEEISIPEAPILKLPSDLLYRIFYTIAASEPPDQSFDFRNDPSVNPLNIIHKASHVCQQWNSIILNSPAIWGRCVNIDALHQNENHWRELVLQRTGTSSLSVAGSLWPRAGVWGFDQAFETFLSKLFTENWQRLEAFRFIQFPSLWIHWPIFIRPPKNLKIFILKKIDGDQSISRVQLIPPSVDPPLFSSHAPSLRYLSIEDVNIPVDLSSMQCCNLAHLNLSNHFVELTDVQLLAMCHRTPYLETLYIALTNLTITHSSTSDALQLSMARLKDIQIYCHNLNVCSAFLENITPALGCRLFVKLYIDEWSPQIQAEISSELYPMQCVAKRYMLSLFSEKRLSSTVNFKFHIYENGRILLHCFDGRFCIDAEIRAGAVLAFKDTIFSEFLTAFSSFKYPCNIIDLSFVVWYPGFVRKYSDQIRNSLKAMPLINHLFDLTPTVLADLHHISGSEHIFPLLDTLSLSEVHNDDVAKSIIPFLLTQQAIRPVKILNCKRGLHPPENEVERRQYVADRWPPDVSLFDGLSGLKVVWECYPDTFEYACGSTSKTWAVLRQEEREEGSIM